MPDFLNIALFALSDFIRLVGLQFISRSFLEWTLFFMPIFVFGEFPRYIFPALLLAVARPLNLLKSDEGKKRAFLATNPSVSILLVGYNEQDCVGNAIKSLLELNYNNLEIIVVDDNSEDNMFKEAKYFADKGLIKLYRNRAATGRAGRPTSSNMAFHLSKGDFVISVDADTSFDRDILLHMIGPFYNNRVGAVAGNIKVRNIDASPWTSLQAIEYALSISMWKMWLGLLGLNMQVSGAFGSFRRETLLPFGAWDPELAEDADLSLKIKKIGWKIVFAPKAIAMTNAPDTWKILRGQRFRWDKGAFRTYFRKHVNIMDFRVFDWRDTIELSLEFLFTVVLTVLYAFYIAYMLIYHPMVMVIIWVISYVIYVTMSLICFIVTLTFSERNKEEVALLPMVLLFPAYKSLFRWVRLAALTLEYFRVNYEEGYLPESAWRNTEKW